MGRARRDIRPTLAIPIAGAAFPLWNVKPKNYERHTMKLILERDLMATAERLYEDERERAARETGAAVPLEMEGV
jgi:hypothetical protein